VNIAVVLIGLVVGTFIGLSGVGGSSLMTPLLIIVLRVHPVIAVGTDLLYSFPTKVVGTLVHRRSQTVDGRLAKTLLIGGIPAAIAGLGVVFVGRAHFSLDVLDAFVRHAVGVALFASAVVLIFGIFARRTSAAAQTTTIDWTRATKAKVIALGALVGFGVSLTSIGSGAITLPALYALLPSLALRRIVGSDIAFATLLIPVAALGHLVMGNADLGLAANLLAGSIPGVILGSLLCRYLPEYFLRPAVAGILIFAGTRLI
jgi:uncharacterized membrane protein YfcA